MFQRSVWTGDRNNRSTRGQHGRSQGGSHVTSGKVALLELAQDHHAVVTLGPVKYHYFHMNIFRQAVRAFARPRAKLPGKVTPTGQISDINLPTGSNTTTEKVKPHSVQNNLKGKISSAYGQNPSPPPAPLPAHRPPLLVMYHLSPTFSTV